MDIRASNGFVQNFFSRSPAALSASSLRQVNSAKADENRKNNENQNGFTSPANETLNRSAINGQPSLVREIEEQTPTGFRRTQDFQTADGRIFSRTEEFSFSNRGSIRNVVQQNPSGSTTKLEEALIQQDNGLFTRIQRFTNETGETTTKIENDLASFYAAQLNTSSPRSQPNPFQVFRGTQLDLQV